MLTPIGCLLWIAITESMAQVHELQCCVCVAITNHILFGVHIDTRTGNKTCCKTAIYIQVLGMLPAPENKKMYGV